MRIYTRDWVAADDVVKGYTFDHPPPHVHVAKAGATMKIDLATHQVTEIVGKISDRDVKRAERLVARHAGFLKTVVASPHGPDHESARCVEVAVRRRTATAATGVIAGHAHCPD